MKKDKDLFIYLLIISTWKKILEIDTKLSHSLLIFIINKYDFPGLEIIKWIKCIILK